MSVQTANLFRSISNAVWSFGRNINSILPHGKLPQPSWAPGPLPRSCERAPMATGVPRRTLSLCPDCNGEVVEGVIRGEASLADFRDRPEIHRGRDPGGSRSHSHAQGLREAWPV